MGQHSPGGVKALRHPGSPHEILEQSEEAEGCVVSFAVVHTVYIILSTFTCVVTPVQSLKVVASTFTPNKLLTSTRRSIVEVPHFFSPIGE